MNTPPTDAALAEHLNRSCACVQNDVPSLQRLLGHQLALAGIESAVTETHPNLFAESPVFIAATHLAQMRRVVQAVSAVVEIPAYQEQALARAPGIAGVDPAARGVLFGFDFHIDGSSVQLIEINTNAGGALLNVEMQRQPLGCCDAMSSMGDPDGAAEDGIAAMFLEDWRRARGTTPLSTIALVDDDPAAQFLFPEFLLFQRLFEARGIHARIADARSLRYDRRALWHEDRRIDLVYNRLTDFYLEEPAHAALADAYRDGAVVLTPHPRAHALYAHKRNLVVLSDAAALLGLGASREDIDTLVASVPRTLAVLGDEHRWWAERKQWFFKPVHGYGSRGAYRGDKITRRVLGELMQRDYVAQRFAPPGERCRTSDTGTDRFKVDVRAYVYGGRIHLLAARVYQGQTTNFRTAGGGFAPVLIVP